MGKNTDNAQHRAHGAQDNAQHRLYSAQDMVRIRSSECACCGACCRGMGDTIVLDPYDVWQLVGGTGRTFEELMGAGIDLHVEEGVILPHLMMREDTKGCSFLAKDGKCAVHAYRPGLCRLFPLGREFHDDGVSYFIVPEGCVKGGLSKVRIGKWLGIADLPRYERFKGEWHLLVQRLRARLAAEPSDEVRRNVNVYFLQTFYMTPYGGVTAEGDLSAAGGSSAEGGLSAAGCSSAAGGPSATGGSSVAGGLSVAGCPSAAAFYEEFAGRRTAFEAAVL